MSRFQNSKQEEQQPTGTLKNRRAFWRLCFALACIGSATWILATAAKPVTSAPPPWQAFLFVLLAAITLLKPPARVKHVELASSDGETQTSSQQKFWSTQGFTRYLVDGFPRRIVLLIAALILSGFVLNRLPKLGRIDNYLPVALAWLLSISLYMLAVISPKRPRSGVLIAKLNRLWFEKKTEVLILGAIILIALLVRVLYLASVPFTLGGDEASQGLEALRVIEANNPNPLTTGWSWCSDAELLL